jgi:hypothetical protein
MYAQQSSIDPSLAALLQTAQMVTPDQKTPTVAAHVAQAAVQKLMPQGIAQGMNQVRQDVQAAIPSVARNAQEAQMRQALQLAMQPKPAGIEGLQSNVRMAEGGVVGYAEGGTPRTYGYAPDYEDARRLGIALSPYDSPEDRKQKLERLQKMREFEKERPSFGDIPTEASVARDQLLQRAYADPTRARDVIGQDAARTMSPGRTMAPPAAASAEGQRLATARSMPTQFDVGIGALPALRRAAQMVGGQEREDILNKISELESAQTRSMAQPAAPSGIAAVPAQPTLAGAMSEVEKIMPGTGTEQNRKALEELQAMRRARPASGIGSLAALQEEAKVMADLKAKEDASAQERGIMAWLAGRGGRGASAQSYMGYQQNEQQRQKLFAQENTIRAAKIDTINDANEARKVGDQEKYVEALNKLSELDRADKQVKAQLAGTTLQAQATMRGQDIQAREGELNRQARDEIKQLPSFEQQMAERAMNDWMRQNPGKSFADAWEWYAGARTARGVDQRADAARERNAIARQKLLNDDMMYAGARMAYVNATDPAKKAEALRKMKEIERLNGIVDEGEPAPAGKPAPPVGTVMQGYRFKGGNPADKNNWEKV